MSHSVPRRDKPLLLSMVFIVFILFKFYFNKATSDVKPRSNPENSQTKEFSQEAEPPFGFSQCNFICLTMDCYGARPRHKCGGSISFRSLFVFQLAIKVFHNLFSQVLAA